MASIFPGLSGYHDETAQQEHSAAAVGSGLLDVFSTPSLVALMERTACASIQPYLQAGESSVGAEINVRHLKPTSIGDRLRCESHVLNVEGRKVTFKIQAWDSKVKIGEATHVRYIIDNKRFLEKLG